MIEQRVEQHQGEEGVGHAHAVPDAPGGDREGKGGGGEQGDVGDIAARGAAGVVTDSSSAAAIITHQTAHTSSGLCSANPTHRTLGRSDAVRSPIAGARTSPRAYS